MSVPDQQRTVLVFPGGSEIGLEIARALHPCKEVRLVSAGLSGTSADLYFKKHYEVPTVEHPGWMHKLREVIAREGVSHILPAHDSVIVPLLENEEALNAKIVSSCLKTCRIARSKSKTTRHLASVAPVPLLFSGASSISEFPVFVKPDEGQGSRGARAIYSRQELEAALAGDPSLIIQSFLPGREYTVDCFSDRIRGVLYARGRTRSKITNGIAARSAFLDDSRFSDLAKRIQGVLPFRGGWFFQVKEAGDGDLTVMEVAPRIAGSSGLSRVSGVNLPLLSLYESDGVSVTIPPLLNGVSLDRTLFPAYSHHIDYDALYVDFDDTLVIEGSVNTLLVLLIYQCVNRGVPVVLVTRHAGDLKAALRKYRLEYVFDKIVHLQSCESKRDAITHSKALFVDDSHKELQDLRQRSGVTALHVSAIHMLISHNER